MWATLLIAANDVRRRLRNRSIVIQGVVAPIVLAGIITLAFGDVGFDATVGIVDADASAVSTGLVDGVMGPDAPAGEVDGGEVDGGEQAEGGLRFERFADAAGARRAVDDGDVGAVVVVPEGFGAAIDGTAPVPLEVIVDADRPVSAGIATAVAGGIASRVDTARLAVAASALGGREVDGRLAGAAADVAPAFTLDEVPVGGDFDPATYFAPAMAILFLFFTVGVGARGLLSERRDGTLARVRAAPVGEAAVLVGKSLGIVVLGLVSLSVVWGTATVAFGADFGDPAGVAAVIVAVVLAVAGIGMGVAALVRTDAQADGYTSMVTFVLALLGGNFVAPADMPDGLRRLSLLTPNGWALRAFTDLAAGDAGLSDILPAVGVLVAMASLFGGGALLVLRRRTLL